MTLGISSGHDDFEDSQIFCLTKTQMEWTKLMIQNLKCIFIKNINPPMGQTQSS